MGVNALTYAALYIFEKIAQEKGFKFNYTLLGTGNEVEHRGSITVDAKNIDYLFIPMVYPTFRGLLKRNGRRFLKAIFSSDIVVDVGEGDSFSDIYGTERFKSVCFPKVISIIMRKKQILLPQTIGPFNGVLIRKIANFLIGRIRHVFPRDKISYLYLKENFPSKSFKESVDMAFNLPYHRMKIPDNKTHIGINISALLWNGGYNRSNMFSLVIDYKKLLRNIVAEFCGYQDTVVHLIPHVVPENFEIEDDYLVAKEIHNAFDNTVLSPKFRDPIEAKNYISGMSFFVGSRMHACIAAYSTGVPVALIAYSRKFAGLFEYTLGYNHVFDAKSQNEEEILNGVISCFIHRGELAKEIVTGNNIIKTLHEGFIDEISNLL
jgi:colanic acid/amylovoran biosynthesis protein